MFFEWKKIAEEMGNQEANILAVYVPEKYLLPNRSSGLIPLLGKMVVGAGKLLYSTATKNDNVLSIRPTESALILKGNKIEGLYYQGYDPSTAEKIGKKGFKLLSAADCMIAWGLYLINKIDLNTALIASFGAWIKEIGPLWESEDLSLLMVQNSPFDLELKLGENKARPILTKDLERVSGNAYAQIRIQVSETGKLVDLIGSKKCLTLSDVQQGLENDFFNRTLIPHLSTLSAAELRTNPEVHNNIETFAKAGVAEYYERFGISLERFTISWDLTEAEKRQIQAKEIFLDQSGRDLQSDLEKKNLKRSLEKTFELEELKSDARKKSKEMTVEETKHTVSQESALKQDLLKINAQEEKLKHELILEEMKLEKELVQTQSELAKFKKQHDFEIKKDVFLQEKELSKIQQEKHKMDLEASLEIDSKKHETDLQKRLREAEVKSKIELGEDERDLKKLEQLKKMEREDYLTCKKVEAEIESEKLKGSQEAELKKKEMEIQLRIKELQIKSGLSADQMLALGASESPDLAKALGEKYKSESQKSEEMLRKMSEMVADQMNTAQKMALQYGAQMADVAKVAAGAKNPDVQKMCSKCGQTMQSHWKVCPNCG